jgi:hypothetical protein
MSDSPTAVEQLTEEVRALRRGDPATPKFRDPSVPVDERIADAEARGEWRWARELYAQLLADDILARNAPDTSITLAMEGENGQEVDVRDRIQELTTEARQARQEGDLETAALKQDEAQGLSGMLGQAQLDAEQHRKMALIWEATSGIADAPAPGQGDGRWDGQQAQNEPPPPAEEQYPDHQLAAVIRDLGHTLGEQQVNALRGAILSSQQSQAQGDVRLRMAQAERDRDRRGMAQAGAEWVAGMMASADKDGKVQAAPRPAPQAGPQWRMKVIAEGTE